MKEPDFARARAAMVAQQLAARDIDDPRVLAAFGAVPREAFVPEDAQAFAYDDNPLPIGDGQTISQPYIVALSTQALALRGGERVLEIGTGSGYAAAVLARIAGEVHSVERIPRLAEAAAARLAALGIGNVKVHLGDGTLGWSAAAPYDAIVVTAVGPELPAALKQQLAPGGRLVMPVGQRHGAQELLCYTRGTDGRDHLESLCGVRFVPLLGAQGF